MIGNLVRQVRESRAIWTAGGHPRDPVIVKILGASNRSLSGVSITRESVIRCPAFWKGVQLIAGSVAKLPTRIYRWLDDSHTEGSEPARQHPAYRLIRKNPSGPDYLTAFIFKQTLQGHALIEGNGYAYIWRDKTGRPTSLVPLDPTKTYPVRMDGVLWYVTRVRIPDEDGDYQSGSSELRKLYPENVIHIRGMGFDGLQGYPITDVGRDAMGRALAAQDLGCKFFANGATSNGILMVPAGVDEEELLNLRESWNRLNSGIDNACKIMLLEEGYKFEKTTIPPNEAQFVETEEMMIIHIANLLNVPPHKLGSKIRSSYNSLEQENLAFLNETLDFWLANWEQELELKLLTTDEYESDTHYIKFDRSAIAEADQKTQAEIDQIDLQNGTLSRDERRAHRHLNPIPGGEGKRFLVALNMGDPGGDPAKSGKKNPAATAAKQQADADEEPQDETGKRSAVLSAVQQAMGDAVHRITKRIGLRARRAAQKPDKFLDWLNSIEAEHGAVADDMLSPAITVLAAIEGTDPIGRLPECRAAIFGGMRESLLKASECKPAELENTVNREMDRWERRGASDVFNLIATKGT